ncbi:MAG TPA: M2 family metallopeptidase [Candidatus Krumholzibacteria bacterium]|nr:M2 family metallopeptidase [Candidatus Krumholzibacteria bacterium]
MTDFRSFAEAHIARVEPLAREVNLAYWTATISGQAADFDRYAALEVELQNVYADRDEFALLKGWHDAGRESDAIVVRQLDLLYRAYLRNQVDPALIESTTRMSSQIVRAFGTYRARVDGRELTGNDVRTTLKTSTDSSYRQAVWEADKAVGREVLSDLLELVRLRNRIATDLGFADYYTMSLELAEQSTESIVALFDRLDGLTAEPFRAAKREIDEALAARYGVDVNAIRPWHYEDPFFQEAPRIFAVDFDGYYRERDVVELARAFYAGIGLDVNDIIARSDLYEKPGKEQHAYCLDIDRRGDVRVLANVKNDENWTGTMLHELGHAVYDSHVDPALPFLLREHAHVFATEAIAMLFGRLSKDAQWIEEMLGLPANERSALAASSRHSSRLSQIIFARWCQVMMRFERALYAAPEQDLNHLWWDLVERYQFVSRPAGRDEPDWAAKIHIVSAPVYYHNYMLGELFASQLDHAIQQRALGAQGGRRSMVGQKAVGMFLRDHVFAAGKRFHWDELVRRSTGHALAPDHFVDQFVR